MLQLRQAAGAVARGDVGSSAWPRTCRSARCPASKARPPGMVTSCGLVAVARHRVAGAPPLWMRRPLKWTSSALQGCGARTAPNQVVAVERAAEVELHAVPHAACPGAGCSPARSSGSDTVAADGSPSGKRSALLATASACRSSCGPAAAPMPRRPRPTARPAAATRHRTVRNMAAARGMAGDCAGWRGRARRLPWRSDATLTRGSAQCRLCCRPRAVILRHAFIPPDNARLAPPLRQPRRAPAQHRGGAGREHHAAQRILPRRRRRSARPSVRWRYCSRSTTVRGARAARRAGAAGPGRGDGRPEAPALRAAARRCAARRRRRDRAAHAAATCRPHAQPGRLPAQHPLHDITFGIGPAGTGKTFLAVACAVDALERTGAAHHPHAPGGGAGERLGFLPGDLAQKVDPYLRPLYDALYDLMGFDRVTKAFEGRAGDRAAGLHARRTLNHAFVILDGRRTPRPSR